MGQNHSSLRVINADYNVLGMNTSSVDEVIELLKTWFSGNVGNNDNGTLAGKNLIFTFKTARAIEIAARSSSDYGCPELRQFLDDFIAVVKLLNRAGVKGVRATMLTVGRRSFFTGSMQRLGVTIVRHYEHLYPTESIRIYKVEVPLELTYELATKYACTTITAYTIDRAIKRDEWGLLGSEAQQDALAAKYPPIHAYDRRALADLQRRNLEQLIILPQDLKRRVYGQLLEHSRYAVDLRTRFLDESTVPLRGYLTTNTEPTFCGAALLADDQIFEEFAEAELEVRNKCQPLFLFDSGSFSIEARMLPSFDCPPRPGGPTQAHGFSQGLNVAPMPGVKRITLAFFMLHENIGNMDDILKEAMQNFLRVAPNVENITLRFWLEAREENYELIDDWCKQDWTLRLGSPVNIYHEASEYCIYDVPVGDEKTAKYFYCYTGCTQRVATHFFRIDDYLRLLDCTLAEPMDRKVYSAGYAMSLLDGHRGEPHIWTEQEGEFLQAAVPVVRPCTIQSGKYEQCNCAQHGGLLGSPSKKSKKLIEI
ncbi:hypothetical protein C1H76_4581 [Elsinoe australis]|uniref:Uncharacterized protein n=1 Tax=Elsinoe australis TaxID=40998 RepID=A0A4U7B2B3_9PEZI|nr:hypothetical protein C1H76_4581 [Elsinoe australis]